MARSRLVGEFTLRSPAPEESTATPIGFFPPRSVRARVPQSVPTSSTPDGASSNCTGGSACRFVAASMRKSRGHHGSPPASPTTCGPSRFEWVGTRSARLCRCAASPVDSAKRDGHQALAHLPRSGLLSLRPRPRPVDTAFYVSLTSSRVPVSAIVRFYRLPVWSVCWPPRWPPDTRPAGTSIPTEDGRRQLETTFLRWTVLRPPIAPRHTNARSHHSAVTSWVALESMVGEPRNRK